MSRVYDQYRPSDAERGDVLALDGIDDHVSVTGRSFDVAVCAVGGVLGAADAVPVAVRQTTVMLTTPDHMRGRAFALMILAAQTANNIGTIWVGAWAAVIGAANTMLLGGAISVVATALIWRLWPQIREFRS